MSDNGNQNIVRNGVNGEEIYHKLSALGDAYTALADAGYSFDREITYGLYLLHSQTLRELKQFVYGEEEGKPGKDGE